MNRLPRPLRLGVLAGLWLWTAGSSIPAEAVSEGTGAACAERHGLLHRARGDGGAERPSFSERLHRYGLGCYATHNMLGCTSLGAECTFIFGSCRAFFGGPCLPG